MKITVKGEMSFRQVIQALYEALQQIETDHAFKHSRGVTLYINPTDGEGKRSFRAPGPARLSRASTAPDHTAAPPTGTSPEGGCPPDAA
ncbi:MAG: hypothetical protein HWD60_00235 [Defluviicoccus sp.]|nr:MAG: hypothetical protein HWD60_00235 [Defluviicoccus sp.]